MKKIVYNRCYGGFSLSDKAIYRYYELLGKPLFRIESRYGPHLTLADPSALPEGLTEEQRHEALGGNEVYVSPYDFKRDDPLVVQVVEELGSEANGMCADLAITEVSGSWRIDEYDGRETVETPNSYEWND
jgi:hypothetical protein